MNGNRWFIKVIRTAEGKYYARMEIEGNEVKNLPEDVDYNTLKNAIELKTGIVILKHKDMFFEKLSATEKIATIDATQCRGDGKDCRVRIEELVRGWKPAWEIR